MKKHTVLQTAMAVIACSGSCHAGTQRNVPSTQLKQAFFGDLHLHTSYSLDAYFMGTTRIDPADAYRFAKGESISYLGQPIQRREPLDFLAVTDHSELIGLANALEDPNSAFSQSEFGKEFRNRNPKVFQKLGNWPNKVKPISDMNPRAIGESAWQRVIKAANRYYEPGRFTTFIAYEWSAQPNDSNLHRNVIFKGNSAPYPFTALDSIKPEDLWTWMETIRRQGYEALAIPHNGNLSRGSMFEWTSGNGSPMDFRYANLRQANEPLSEIVQTKGASETHPTLSPTDEFAEFEIFNWSVVLRNPAQGSYLRDALSRGLILQGTLGVNPFKYGFVGGSDLHTGLSVSAQADYTGDIARVNMGDGKPDRRQAASLLGYEKPSTWVTPALRTTSGGLTGVWAESNTRESIYEAIRRRETFATSGTKLKVRFFGGWNLHKEALIQKDWVETAYAGAVPMGEDLPSMPVHPNAPSFLIWALKDPNGANLDRVQVVKTWAEEGKQKEAVFDVVWAGSRAPDPKTGKVPSIGNSVDITTGRYSNGIGAVELKAAWKDPEFNPRLLAAYYVRVLEIPTPRWSTLLALQTGLPIPKDVPSTTQQRGWSSPIWYVPAGSISNLSNQTAK